MQKSIRERGAVVLVAAGLALTACAVSLASTTGLLDPAHKIAAIQSKVSRLLASGGSFQASDLTAICGSASPRQVFRPWGDLAWYVPAPGGSMEDTTGWTINDRALFVPGNNAYSTGSQSLYLGQNGQAITPAICVSTAKPTIRFFARTNLPSSVLKVTVLYEGLDGNVHQLKIANLTGSGFWQPSLVIPYYVNLIAAASPSGVTAVAFQFDTQSTSSPSGGWMIDDLYVDPVKIL